MQRTQPFRLAIFTTLLVAAGCGDPPSSVGTDTSVDDTEPATADSLDTYTPPDFDDFETGDSTGSDSAGDATDSDTGTPLPIDSAGCPFGEIVDCTGGCYPSHLLGDGFCDDGTQLPADFDCAAFGYDRGDCPLGPATGCDYAILFTPRSFPGEISWNLETSTGQILQGINPGAYTQNGRTYRHEINLTDGTYTFQGYDSFGDGWHRAEWQLVDTRTGRVVFENDPNDFIRGTGSPPGEAYAWTFDVTCQRASCEINVETVAAQAPSTMGWELWTVSDGRNPQTLVPTVSRSPGSLPAGTSTERLDLDQALYELRTRSTDARGWRGGSVSLRYDGGWETTVGSVADNSPTGAVRFRHQCSLQTAPPAQSSVPTIEPASCSGVRLETRTRFRGDEVGWDLIREADFRRLREMSPGTMNSNEVRSLTTSLTTGRYILRMQDAGGDGWSNARWRVIEPEQGAHYLDFTLLAGGSGVLRFDVTCPPPPTDTGEPEGRTCLDDAIEDCRGVCMPEALLGDGTCDDGTTSPVDFDCEAFDRDLGDCVPPEDTDIPVDTDTDVVPDTDTDVGLDTDTDGATDTDVTTDTDGATDTDVTTDTDGATDTDVTTDTDASLDTDPGDDAGDSDSEPPPTP